MGSNNNEDDLSKLVDELQEDTPTPVVNQSNEIVDILNLVISPENGSNPFEMFSELLNQVFPNSTEYSQQLETYYSNNLSEEFVTQFNNTINELVRTSDESITHLFQNENNTQIKILSVVLLMKELYIRISQNSS